jgi:hypothetical protein
MTRACITVLTALLLGSGSAIAQTAPGLPPIGLTSPLGVGPGAPVPPVRIPLGATQMQSLGVSPLTSGVSPASPTLGVNSTCAGIGGSIPEASFGMASSATGSSGIGSAMSGTSFGTGTSSAGTSVSTSVFDGVGMTGNASGTCPVTAGSSLGNPAASASSPSGVGSPTAGRLGVPLGSTELGVGGLSPPLTNPTPSTTLNSSLGTLPCATTGIAGTTSGTGMTPTNGTFNGMTTTGSC